MTGAFVGGTRDAGLKAGRFNGRGSGRRKRRKSEVGGRLADQDGDRVFVLGASYADIDGFGASCFEDSASLFDVDL
jgi:hypothetical protein